MIFFWNFLIGFFNLKDFFVSNHLCSKLIIYFSDPTFSTIQRIPKSFLVTKSKLEFV